MKRKEGYYWVKWGLPGLGWSIGYWSVEKEIWFVLNSEETFSNSYFELIGDEPLIEPEN